MSIYASVYYANDKQTVQNREISYRGARNDSVRHLLGGAESWGGNLNSMDSCAVLWSLWGAARMCQ